MSLHLYLSNKLFREYKTLAGGVCSFIITFLIIFYTVIMMIVLIGKFSTISNNLGKKDTNKSVNTESIDLFNDLETVQLE
jgi:hypothetical protein